ncbi:hypothetical protein T265_03278 [Opisthorchis viverrini]|uniref:Cwf19-like C-terminal domain-containing protein n=1 Tax=Opisthorchis viverrini TaxID=6198 RepID=A0A075A3U7_OPIVI|nr:hypothetical protein T265_03278 [Opisthorchis viverrini]KER30215.1 hypothetical protein T265_03278 [Opisthorchis viverrini]
MMFCVGDFFGENTSEIEAAIDGDLKIPLPTYIVSPVQNVAKKYVDEKGCTLCENLVFLGSQGIYTTVSGLRVVYISDIGHDSDGEAHLSSSLLSSVTAAEDIGFIGVDLLLTPNWPSGIGNRTSTPLPDECIVLSKTGSKAISKLAYFLRPRYHFSSGMGCYYERAPYRNHRVLQEKASHVTRFIALADVKNPLNRKYLYALKLVPIDKMSRQDLTQQPPDVTENPYLGLVDEPDNSQGKETEVQTDQYFYDMSARESEPNSTRKRPNKRDGEEKDGSIQWKSMKLSPSGQNLDRQRRAEKLEEKLERPREQAACWFCLGNPQVKKHLIVSVNTQAYLALPRGPLVSDHILILTVGHHRSWTTCPDYVRQEIEDYKTRLKRMFTNEGKAVVAFERNLKTQHYQLQVVIPVPFAVAGEVKQAFLDLSARCETSPCALEPIPRNTELNDICAPGIPYFYVELPTGERLFGQIKKDRIATSDIQFGRFVLSDSRILDCPDRADWRNCTDEIDKETELTLAMREKFAPYDVE